MTWHESAAGRRAEAGTPPTSERPKPRPRLQAQLSPTAQQAAKTLFTTMIGIRSVRYAVPPDNALRRAPWQISVMRDSEPSAFSAQTEDFQTTPFEG